MQPATTSTTPVASDDATAIELADFARAQSLGLTRFAYVLCGDRGLAEDFVQDALLALYRRFGDQLRIKAPVAYARRAIVNGYTSHRRRQATSAVVLGDVPEPADEPGGDREHDGMWAALARLPERQRAALVLRYYLDLPDTDIAAALGCRVGTVRSLAARAFAALRDEAAISRTGGSDERRPRAGTA